MVKRKRKTSNPEPSEAYLTVKNSNLNGENFVDNIQHSDECETNEKLDYSTRKTAVSRHGKKLYYVWKM